MAIIPVNYNISYKDKCRPILNFTNKSERFFMCPCIYSKEGSKCLSLNLCYKRRKCHLSRPVTDVPRSENLFRVWYALESNTIKKQLRSLDTYFRKLQNNANPPTSDTLPVLQSYSRQGISKKGLDSLEEYLGKLNQGRSQGISKTGLDSLEEYLGRLDKEGSPESHLSSTYGEETVRNKTVAQIPSVSEESKIDSTRKLGGYMKLRTEDGRSALEITQSPQQYDETSDLYLICILASLNIAVFLFEIASPIRNSEFELFSLPLLYGAKINDLILLGEWWRLVTPMFLHSGFLHVALGCWGLLTFGPEVCRGYGSLTFFLIYILGGISGNLTSFLHTPDATVGGTGPMFAIIGAWLIYQIQNKDVTAKDVSESLFQKAMIATALSCILSNFGPIDDWTHLGSAFTGIAYGFLTCPTQLDNSSSRTCQDEEVTPIKQRHANTHKSLLAFTIFILVLSSLLFFVEPPLGVSDDSYL